jgi:hypothetical protein
LDIKLSNEPFPGHGSGEPTLPQVLCNELFELSSVIDLVGNAAADRLGINQTDLICLNLLVDLLTRFREIIASQTATLSNRP